MRINIRPDNPISFYTYASLTISYMCVSASMIDHWETSEIGILRNQSFLAWKEFNFFLLGIFQSNPILTCYST